MTAEGSPERVWLWEAGFWERGRPPTTNPPLKLNRLSIPNDSPISERTRKKKRSDMSDATSSVPAVIPQPSTATSVVARAAQRPVVGLEDFGPRDMVVPDLKLAQGTTTVAGVAMGEYYNSLDPSEHHKKLRAIAVAFKHGQVYFPRKADGKPDFDADIVCRSNDGKVPAAEIKEPISKRCVDEKGEMECPAGKWAADKKPACSTTHTLLLVDVDSGLPYRFSTKTSELTISKKFLSAVMLKARAHGRSLFDYEFTLGVTKDGAIFVPTFTDITEVEADKHRVFYDLFAKKAVEEPAGDAKGTVVDAAAKGEGEKAAAAPGTTSAPPSKPGKSGKGREMDF